MLTQPALSERERAFLLAFEEDREDAPWMVDSDIHDLAVTGLKLPLRWYGARQHPSWYVGSDLWVSYPLPDGRKKHVAPDIFVALAPNHLRDSFDAAVEGGFPPFVLEVVSPESQTRDTDRRAGKVRLYETVGAEEYVIFDPRGVLRPALQGYHRDAADRWIPWQPGLRGELRSAVLGLTLVPDDGLLRLEDAHGHRLLTADEQVTRADQEHADKLAERTRADQAEAAALAERAAALAERERADAATAEVERLRAELLRLGARPS